jgi:pimeloyl-ACP methyl ester carboxylesterase
MFAVGTGRASAASTPCPWVSPSVTPGKTPVLFVHGIDSSPRTWTATVSPGGTVTGTSEPPLQYVVTSLGNASVAGYTFDWSANAGPVPPLAWVTDNPPSPNLGVRLSQAIGCVARAAGHQVIVIAHSMGGLITKYASSRASADIAAVFTLGTPYQGSWLASAFGDHGPVQTPLSRLAAAIAALCGMAQSQNLVCAPSEERDDSGMVAMRLIAPKGWQALPSWPPGLPVYSLAGNVEGTWQPVWPLNIKLPLFGVGDLVSATGSQRSSLPGMTFSCPVRLGLGSPLGTPGAVSILDTLAASPCFHWKEPFTRALLDDIVGIIHTQHMLPTTVVPSSGTAPAPGAVALPASSWEPVGGTAKGAPDAAGTFAASYAGTYWGGLYARAAVGCNYRFEGMARLQSGGSGYGFGVRARIAAGGVPYSEGIQYDPGAGGYRDTLLPNNSETGTVIPISLDNNWHMVSVEVIGNHYQSSVDGKVIFSGTTPLSCGGVFIRIWRSTVFLRNLSVTPITKFS